MTRTQRIGLAMFVWGIYLLTYARSVTDAGFAVFTAMIGFAFTVIGLFKFTDDEEGDDE